MRSLITFLLLSVALQAVATAQDETIPLDDSGAWYTTLFLSGRQTPEEQRLLSWFSTNEQLVRLKKSTHFSIIKPSDAIWSRYWDGSTDANGTRHPRLIASVPAVVVQRPNGDKSYTPVAKFQAPSKYFESDRVLANAIALSIRQNPPQPGAGRKHPLRPWLDCDDCGPKPNPNPKPDPGPEPFVEPLPLTPDIGPVEEEETEEEEEAEEEIVQEAVAEVKQEETADRSHKVIIALAILLAVAGFAYFKDRQAQTY